MTPGDFSEYYKTISHAELLKILDRPENYQPLAVEAAKAELVSRQLTDNEMQDARQALGTIQAKKEAQKEKAAEVKIKAAANTFFDTINPIQPGIPSTEKTIRFIVIVFSFIFLYQLIAHFRTYIGSITNFPRFPFDSVLYLYPQLLLGVATFTFWKRKTLGWSLLTIFVTYAAVGAALLLVESLTWKPSGVPSLDRLFPIASPTTCIFQLIFLIGTLVALIKSNIREVYVVNKQKAGITIGVTALLTSLIILVLS